LIFDGNSVVFDASGNVVGQAKDFAEDLLIVDVPGGPGRCENASRGVESIYKALVLGLRDYVHKCGFAHVVLGLSGGIDSALTAVLAADALGAEKVLGLAMPSRFSSDHSIADAGALAKNLGIRYQVLPIASVHDAFEAALAQSFAGRSRDVTEENLQARLRGALLMAFSNKFNSLLLTTGNKSELATGYCTIYGDMCGGLAVLSDVPKTTVYELARWINAQAGRMRIPQSSIDKVPSAELRPNQSDQDSLPDYALLDAILLRYVEQEQSAGQIIAEGFDAATVQRVIRLVDRSEYKRRQAAPGLKVTSRAFGFGRRMPIAQNYRQHGE
jgi:NAD+ synthetase